MCERIWQYPRQRAFVFLVLSWACFGSFLTGCRDATNPVAVSAGKSAESVAPWTPRSHEGFVGSKRCQRCHEDIYEKYQGHPMAKAMSPSSEITDSIEHRSDLLVFSDPAFLEYEIEVAGDMILHHERVLDDEGSILVRQTEPIAFALGSGARGRSYLLEREGELFMSPLSWYTRDRKWGLSPGFTPADHSQFSRPISDRCLRCHCGQTSAIKGGTAEFPAYEKPIVAELGISCERCHGPGKSHIEFHDGGKTFDNVADPIVNPTKLEAIERDDVCNQCHLQGRFEVLRPGRQPDDFRPGDAISDIWTVFIEGTNVEQDQSTKAVSHVQQMQTSRCYIKSGRALGCVSCHDPHGMTHASERAAQFRQACLQCHQTESCTESDTVRQQTSTPDNCSECHMPRLSTNDVPHTTQTDHRIRKNPRIVEPLSDEKNLPKGSETDYEVYEGNTHPIVGQEFERALGIAIVRDATQTGDLELYNAALKRLLPLKDVFRSDLIYLEALALALQRTEQIFEAVDVWKTILEIDPKHGETLLRLGSHFGSEGQLGQADKYLTRYVAVKPHEVDGNLRLSMVKGQLLEIDEAIQYAERALDLNPRNWETRRWLVTLYRDSRQLDKMRQMQAVLDKINQNRLKSDSNHAPLHRNGKLTPLKKAHDSISGY